MTNYQKIFNYRDLEINPIYQGYDFLEAIHLEIFGDYFYGFASLKRYEDNTFEYEVISKTVNELLNLNLSEDIDSLSYTLAYDLSLLFMYQPFYDGNARTVILFFKYLLKKYNKEFLWELENYDIKSIPFFSIFYNPDDTPNVQNINYIKNKLVLTRKTF